MVNNNCDDSVYRYKIVWFNNKRKVINRVFCCNMPEVCKELNIQKVTLVHLLKNTAHHSKYRNIKIERVYIPRKVISYTTYKFDPDKEEDSDSDYDSDNILIETTNTYSSDGSTSESSDYYSN